MSIEALKLARDELRRVKEICLQEAGIGLCSEVVMAKVDKAIAELEKQKPVCYRVRWPKMGGGYAWVMSDVPLMEEHGFVNEALYTHPQPKAEQGQHLSSHTDQYWLHEINNALAEGYTKGRASAKAEQEPCDHPCGDIKCAVMCKRHEPKREPLTPKQVEKAIEKHLAKNSGAYSDDLTAAAGFHFTAGYAHGYAAHSIKGEA